MAASAPPDPHETLMAAALVLGVMKRQLARTGYPFPLPPGTDAVLRDIDSIVFPEEPAKVKARAAA